MINKRQNGTIWLTIVSTLFAILVCISATGMIYLVYPHSGRLLQLIFSPQSQNPTSLDSWFDEQPTPFLPLPTHTPTIIPSTPVPTVTPTPQPTPTKKPTVDVPEVPNETPPPSAYISGVFGSPQLFTLDCESQASVDWARFFGVQINELEFIDQLPTSDDPEQGFVGNINGPMGQIPPNDYGVYPGPIASILQNYGVNAAAVKGWDIKSIKNEIAAGRPVIVWVVNLPFSVNPQEYTASNGNTTIVAPFQHTWIVTGYNSTSFTVVDSEWTYNVLTQTFLERWNALENRAIVMIPEK